MSDSSLHFFRKVFKNNLWFYLIAYSNLFIFNFVKVPLLTSIYTPEQLGTYAYYGAVLSYLDVIFLSWISSTAWRYIYEKNEGQSITKLISTLLPLLAFFILLSIICLFFLLFYFKYKIAYDILITGYFTIVTQQLLSLYLLYLQSQNRISKWCTVISIQNIFSLVILLFLSLGLEKGVVSIYLSTSIVNASLLIWTAFRYRYKLKLLIYRCETSYYKKIISYSLLVIISGICLMILNNADRFIIDYYKGKSSVGLYSQTYSLAYIGFYSALQVFSTVFLPIYNKNLASTNNFDTNRMIIQLYIILFTPMLFFCIFHSSIITQLFLGENFEGHDNIFRLVLLSIYCFGFGNFFEIRLKFHNKIKIVALVLIITALLNISLNICLLKLYSIETAAINTLLSFALLAVFFILLNLKFFFSISLRKIILKQFYATCLFFIFSYTSKEIFQQYSNLSQLIIYALSCFIVYLYFSKKDIAAIMNNSKSTL